MAHRATEILDAMRVPSNEERRTDYRPYATDIVAAIDFEQLRGLCAFLRTDIARLVTRVIDYQFDRARRQRGLERSARRKRGYRRHR